MYIYCSLTLQCAIVFLALKMNKVTQCEKCLQASQETCFCQHALFPSFRQFTWKTIKISHLGRVNRTKQACLQARGSPLTHLQVGLTILSVPFKFYSSSSKNQSTKNIKLKEKELIILKAHSTETVFTTKLCALACL